MRLVLFEYRESIDLLHGIMKEFKEFRNSKRCARVPVCACVRACLCDCVRACIPEILLLAVSFHVAHPPSPLTLPLSLSLTGCSRRRYLSNVVIAIHYTMQLLNYMTTHGGHYVKEKPRAVVV